MSVIFKEFTQANVIGSVAAVIGIGGSIDYTLENLHNPAVRVQLILTNAVGLKSTIVCSPKVSELLRKKEIKLSNLVTFPVSEQTALSGETINVIGMPASSRHAVSIKLADLTPAEYKPAVAELTKEELEDTIAL